MKTNIFSVEKRTKQEFSNQNFRFPDSYECSWVLKGHASFVKNKTESVLHANSVYQIFPTDNVCFLKNLSDDYSEYHIRISTSTYSSLKELNALYSDSNAFTIIPEPFLIHWSEDHLHSLANQHSDDLFEFFFNTQKLLIAIHKSIHKLTFIKEYEAIQTSLPILSGNFHTRISLEEIAFSFGYTYETFRKKFKKHIGLSPLQFRLETKFRFAKRLLMNGYSIAEVAEATGYADAFIFSRQFKKYTGENPKAFKGQ